MRISISLFAVGTALVLALAASAITIDWVTVGAPGNAGDTSPKNCGQGFDQPCGSVSYEYQIGKYEVTNTQYAEFLNAVAITDANGLYNTNMNDSTSFGGITPLRRLGQLQLCGEARLRERARHVRLVLTMRRASSTGSRTASPAAGRRPPSRRRTAPTRSRSADSARSNAGATVFVPNEHEWYKAALLRPGCSRLLRLSRPVPTRQSSASRRRVAGTRRTCNDGLAPDVLTDVGAYVLSDSPFGTFDQGGNVRGGTRNQGSGRGVRAGAGATDRSASLPAIRSTASPTPRTPPPDFASEGSRPVPEPGTCLL